MALLDELTKVIDEIQSKETRSFPEESRVSDGIKTLVDDLMDQLESQEETAIDLSSNSSQEIDHLIELILEEIENYQESSTDPSDSVDEIERLLDLLFELITGTKRSHFLELKNGNPQDPLNNLAEHSLKNDSRSRSESVQESVDVPESEPNSQPGKPQNNTAQLVEQLFQSMTQSVPEPVTERSPQPPEEANGEEDSRRTSKSVQESVDVPESEPNSQPGKPLNNTAQLLEQLFQSMTESVPEPVTERSPQPAEEISVDPDPEEVAHSVEYLRQLMFQNQSSPDSATQATKSADDLAETANTKATKTAESHHLDRVSSDRTDSNSDESQEFNVQGSNIQEPNEPNKLLDELLDEVIDELIEQPDQPIDRTDSNSDESHGFNVQGSNINEPNEPNKLLDGLLDEVIDELIEQPDQPIDRTDSNSDESQESNFQGQNIQEPMNESVDKVIDEWIDQSTRPITQAESTIPQPESIDQLTDLVIDRDRLVTQINQLTTLNTSSQRNDSSLSQPPNQQSAETVEPIEGSQLTKSEFTPVEIVDPLEEAELQEIEPKVKTMSDFKLLQSLLVDPEVDPLRHLNQQLDAKLAEIDEKIHNPQALINLLLPVIAELLNLKVEQSKEDIAHAIAPIIDQAIQQRSLEDKTAMSAVLATLIPEAISYQIKQSPEDIAKAIAPEIAPAIREQIKLDRAAIANVLAPQMSDAIKEQIKLEQESMVDALYPVIGSTVAKYIAEAIRDINEKIAKALSADGLRRKIRAKLHGVSEGELILQESIAAIVQAVFLIHKESGLIISEAQPDGAQQLESEMVAGMLTAIRSFVNDCIVQSGEVAELDDIEYGLSTIKLEVAGYCYLAVLIKGGSPPKKFVAQIRKTLSKIVLYYSKTIQEFDGDPETIPPEIHEMIQELVKSPDHQNQKKAMPLLQMLVMAVAGLIFVPFGWNFYQYSLESRLKNQVLNALNTNPELAIYSFNVQVDDETVTLKGKLPNDRLRSEAEAIVKKTLPNLELNNQILAVEMPVDPVFTKEEVKRVTETLNQMAGIAITAEYIDGKVTVDGIVIQETDSQNIAQAFAKIPGVTSVVSAVQLQPLTIETRIYFEQNSSKIKPEDVKTKLIEIKRFLTQYPQVHLNIVGHSDRTGKRPTNQRLALKRAETVQFALISLGLAPERLHISANPEPPIDVDKNQPDWKHRCVIFYPIIPQTNESSN